MASVPVIALDTAGYVLAVAFGLLALFFGGRALQILRRPPTGEAARELVFLTGRDLIPPFGLVLAALAIEWVEWVVAGLDAWGIVAMPAFEIYANIVQALVVLVAGVLAFRVLVPYTRARRTEHTRITLDRLAARVALLRGRK